MLTMWEIADILKISKSIQLLVKMKNVFYFMEKTKWTFGQPNITYTSVQREDVWQNVDSESQLQSVWDFIEVVFFNNNVFYAGLKFLFIFSSSFTEK